MTPPPPRRPAAARDPGVPSRVAADWVRRRPSARAVPPGALKGALVVGDPAPDLARALAERGARPTRWRRHLTRGQLCTPWPPVGPFAEAWVRMPRSAAEAVMLLHAAAARVRDGGCIHVFGPREDGIASAARHFPAGTDDPATVAVRRRCRVLCAARRSPPPRPDGLSAWDVRARIDWGAGERDWVFHPGVFACGRLDEGTALLARRLPPLPARTRVLDFGAGTGILGAACLERGAGRAVLLERDAVSLAAAARNVPAATLVLGSGAASLEDRFDLVVSNPPVRSGRAQDLDTARALAREAPGVLARRGRLMVVSQSRLPLARILEESFSVVRTLARTGAFTVWEASAPGRSTPRQP